MLLRGWPGAPGRCYPQGFPGVTTARPVPTGGGRWPKQRSTSTATAQPCPSRTWSPKWPPKRAPPAAPAAGDARRARQLRPGPGGRVPPRRPTRVGPQPARQRRETTCVGKAEPRRHIEARAHVTRRRIAWSGGRTNIKKVHQPPTSNCSSQGAGGARAAAYNLRASYFRRCRSSPRLISIAL